MRNEARKSANFLNWISKECMSILMKTKNNQTNYSFSDIKILSKHINTSMKKFKEPSVATLVLIETMRNVLCYMYYMKSKTVIYGKCNLMKGIK